MSGRACARAGVGGSGDAKRREPAVLGLENLRNKLVPIYSYDPSEDHNDVEEEIDTNGEIKDNYELSAEKETRQNVNCASSSDTGIGNQETGALDEKQVLKTESGQ
ncbi:uncharacterized protein LOC127578473 isoform X2 [Pristis pectinata]|uniref:uncharacterized protein LOC127578473 isoform X2 n=1 Tax=Pristis pectinata TaxID=685728 RepID=UPI00223D05C8|nr:uncharacterized protein LOC127578473 isoform X2 [Pristis pectinata]